MFSVTHLAKCLRPNTAVGRWQKNKDLSWYAKGDESEAAISARSQREEEIRGIKGREMEALSAALGFAVEVKGAGEVGVGVKEMERAVKEAGDDEEGGRGVGFGVFGGGGGEKDEGGAEERMLGVEGGKGGLEGVDDVRKEKKSGEGRDRRRRSRSRDGKRRTRRGEDDREKRYRRHRSRSRDRHLRRRLESRERRPERNKERYRSRSRSPARRVDEDRYTRQRRQRSYSPKPTRRREDSRERERGYDRRR